MYLLFIIFSFLYIIHFSFSICFIYFILHQLKNQVRYLLFDMIDFLHSLDFFHILHFHYNLCVLYVMHIIYFL